MNGKLLSGSWDSTANVWSISDLTEGNEKVVFPNNNFKWFAVIF